MAVARFIDSYGAEAFWSPSYPTSDHFVPWKHFLVLMAARQHILAEQQLAMLEAVQLGAARVMGGDKAELDRHVQDLARRAFPDS